MGTRHAKQNRRATRTTETTEFLATRVGFSDIHPTLYVVRLGAVWPTENCIGFSLNQIQCCVTVRESYSSSRALEQGPLQNTIFPFRKTLAYSLDGPGCWLRIFCREAFGRKYTDGRQTDRPTWPRWLHTSRSPNIQLGAFVTLNHLADF